MKKNLWCLLAMVVGIYLWPLTSCGGDDPIDKKGTEISAGGDYSGNGGENNGNGEDNNGIGNIDVPQELLRAWGRTDEQKGYTVYVYNSDGTGQVFYGVNTTEHTAQSVTDFTYSYNRQNSTITIFGTTYTVAFKNGDTKMDWSINDEVIMEFYCYGGELPTQGVDEGGGIENPEQTPNAPAGVTARVDGSSICVSWQSVSGANSYNIYRSTSENGYYYLIGTVYSASYIDNSPISGYNYYKVSAVNNKGESPQSIYASCNYSQNNGPTTLPAPTNVRVANEGNNYIPDIRIRWDDVSGAKTYKIYKSSNANSGYTLMDEVNAFYSSCSDPNPPTSGSRYYKVKAVNGVVESPYSNYAVYTPVNKDDVFKPSFTWGNCTVSGTSMTLRWTYDTGGQIGKPTKVTLRIYNPYTEEWQDTELRTTDTSTTFNFTARIDNDVDSTSKCKITTSFRKSIVSAFQNSIFL